MPITGAPTWAARSITLHIFSAITSPRLPPKTVKSWREDEDGAAVDRAVAGDDGVAPGPVLLHLEVVGAVADEGVELLEGAGVEQLLDPLAGGHLALRVLLLDRLLGGGVDRRLAQLAQVGELLVVGFGVLLAHRRAEVYLRRGSRVPRADEGPAGAGPSASTMRMSRSYLEFGADRERLDRPVARLSAPSRGRCRSSRCGLPRRQRDRSRSRRLLSRSPSSDPGAAADRLLAGRAVGGRSLLFGFGVGDAGLRSRR